MQFPGLNHDFMLHVRELDHYHIRNWEWEIYNETSQVATCWLTIQNEPYSEEIQANLARLSQLEGVPIDYYETDYRLTLVIKGDLFEHELAYMHDGLLMWTKYPTPELVEKARKVVFSDLTAEDYQSI